MFSLYSLLYLSACSSKLNIMNRIKEVLEEKGIKQVWLSKKLNKSFSMVNDYCNNRRQPSLELLFDIAKLLDVEVKDLIKEEKS